MLVRQANTVFLIILFWVISWNAQSLWGQPTSLDSMLVARIQFDRPGIKGICDSLGFAPLFEGNGKYCDYGIQKNQIESIVKSGLKFELISKRMLFPSPIVTSTEVDSIYHTYGEMQSQLLARAAAFPAIAKIETIGVSQQEQRSLYAFKISENVNVDEDEPVVFFDGTHHACEVMGMEICLALIDTLLFNYGEDANITSLINHTEIWLVPLVNPDGHSAVMNDISHYYRKNGRDLNNNGILYEYSCNDWWTCSTEGIDLNRNYDWHWDVGGQSSPTSYYYRGESAGSESENVAITGLLRRIKPLLSISYHSYGEIVFYPWDINGQTAPDHSSLYAIAYGISRRIHRESGTQYYDITPSDGLAGMASNWQYGRLGTQAFTIETIRYYDFIIPAARFHSVISQNLSGCFYLLERAHGSQITGKVFGPDSITPVGAEIRVLENYSDQVDPRYSDSTSGRFRHIVQPGTYSLQAISDRYAPRTMNNIVVTNSIPTEINIYLQPILAGDNNGSGDISAADVTYLVRYFKGLGPAPLPYLAGDANGDCLIRGGDVTYVVSYLKGGPPPHSGDCR
jgi:carboxypeptidase T